MEEQIVARRAPGDHFLEGGNDGGLGRAPIVERPDLVRTIF
jgi:hypothetical protein